MRDNILVQSERVAIQRAPALIRLEKPTNLIRARSLGYSAIQGMVVVRGRVRKGTFRKPSLPAVGRRPARTGITRMVLRTNNQELLERRVSRNYPNLAILGSYLVHETGQNRWYEILMIDPSHPAILSRERYLRFISTPGIRTRQFRGLTAAGRRSR